MDGIQAGHVTEDQCDWDVKVEEGEEDPAEEGSDCSEEVTEIACHPHPVLLELFLLDAVIEDEGKCGSEASSETEDSHGSSEIKTVSVDELPIQLIDDCSYK